MSRKLIILIMCLIIWATCATIFILVPRRQAELSTVALRLPKKLDHAHGYFIVLSRAEGQVRYGFVLDMVLRPKQIRFMDGCILSAEFKAGLEPPPIGEPCFVNGDLYQSDHLDWYAWAGGMYVVVTHIEREKW